jgi:hypothetical protein
MDTNQKFSKLSDKLRYYEEKCEMQVELTFLIIVYYLKMKTIFVNGNSKFSGFLVTNLLLLHWALGILFYYLKAYKKFITILINETYSVLILKQKVWKSVNQKMC